MTERIDARMEAQIDDIVASCDGNIHGALRALLLVNEQLEQEVARLRAAAARRRSLPIELPVTPSSETPCVVPSL